MDKLIDLLSNIKPKNFSYYIKFTDNSPIVVIKFKDGSFIEICECVKK